MAFRRLTLPLGYHHNQYENVHVKYDNLKQNPLFNIARLYHFDVTRLLFEILYLCENLLSLEYSH